MTELEKIRGELKKLTNPKKIEVYKWFFKTGPDEYGEDDVFLGLTSEQIKNVAKKYLAISWSEIKTLLDSKIHDERVCALRILVSQYEKAKKTRDDFFRKKIVDFYLKNTKRVNNWDLVDMSAPKILGDHLLDQPRKILYQLAKSKNLWEKRISIIATFAFIRVGEFNDTLKISKVLLNDDHDLIHKAVGWALREVGKKNLAVEEKFLQKHHPQMPRTMLRYAIEKFNEKNRKWYLNN